MDIHIDYTLIITIMKANLSNWLVTEENSKDTICISGSECYRLSIESLSHPEPATAKGYSATDIHLPHYVTGVIQHRWQHLREATRTGLIPFTRNTHIQRLVWSHMVVCIPPVIECQLAINQASKASTTYEFCLESSVQAFVFALSLGMMWSAMTDVYAQTKQPYCQTSVWIVCIISPSTVLADGAATALGNRIKDQKDLDKIADWADQMGGVTGGLAIVKDKIAAWGEIEMVRT